ncbi:MAG: DUF4423 domain-containing protein [Bacteriovoracaceae bacterium]|nr:DUF4423 domain-containing protein [Bacteriovoracaceae bacterium]
MQPSVYNYQDPGDFLRDVCEYKKRSQRYFSIRSWAKQMDLKGHTSLVFFLKGTRMIRPRHFDKIVSGLKLLDNEKAYLKYLIHLKNSKTIPESEYFELKLRALHPAKKFSYIDLDRFRVISDWSHMAILEMTNLDDFKPDPLWISKRLGGKLSASKVTEVLNRLLGMNLIKQHNNTFIKTHERLTTPKDRPSESIKEHHKQVLINAVEALDKQSVQQRCYNSCTMTVDSSRLDEAKELINKFRSDMAKLMEKKGGDETYQLSVQYYKLTSEIDGGGYIQ